MKKYLRTGIILNMLDRYFEIDKKKIAVGTLIGMYFAFTYSWIVLPICLVVVMLKNRIIFSIATAILLLIHFYIILFSIVEIRKHIHIPLPALPLAIIELIVIVALLQVMGVTTNVPKLSTGKSICIVIGLIVVGAIGYSLFHFNYYY